MPITIDLRENALVKDLIAEVQAETEVYRQLAKEQRRQIEEQRQQAEEQRQQAEEQRQQAEEQRQQAEEQRQQAEEQRQHTRAAILNLYQTLHLEPTLIATIFEISEQEVLGILEAAE